MPDRYWLILPNGARQLIDPAQFDLDDLAARARQVGGRLVVEPIAPAPLPRTPAAAGTFEPPLSALGAFFRTRLDRIHACRSEFRLDLNRRPTRRILGGYYRRRALVRVYTHDRESGRRPLEELFDTFLHEVAHHLEYTEPDAFGGHACGRVPGRMHSRLFWGILGELKRRWAVAQRPA